MAPYEWATFVAWHHPTPVRMSYRGAAWGFQDVAVTAACFDVKEGLLSGAWLDHGIGGFSVLCPATAAMSLISKDPAAGALQANKGCSAAVGGKVRVGGASNR